MTANGSRLHARRGVVRLLLPLLIGSVSGLALQGTAAFQAAEQRPVTIAPGVVTRRLLHGLSAVRVIEVDLQAPGVRVEVAAGEIARRENRVTGRARTLPGWLAETGAVAGVNGGFFGATVGTDFKEVVGLLKRHDRVRAAAPVYRARGGDERYARSALGFTATGRPEIAWATSRPGDPQALRRHAGPIVADGGTRWAVRSAVACGPRLIHRGKEAVSARAERLASPGALPRTFVGYGGPGESPRYLLLCAADAMEFTDCAGFLTTYFRRFRKGVCREALALDGGHSTQAAWKEKGRLTHDPESSVTVPTAVLVYQR